MTAVYFLAAVFTLLALAARRFAWAAVLGMAAGAALVLAALGAGCSGQTLAVLLLCPAAAALLAAKGGKP